MAFATAKSVRGVYKCSVCQHLVLLEDNKNEQPVCPRCTGITSNNKKTKSKA
ncbi:MAG TPA: hypothetical protein PLZ08_07245 [Bacillota bacterium]|jgi:formylmethanofuran dehydrogenase subunit E|nr:hypothetical protein [Bacillota bacterium]HOL09990.1 hypothetical protein [Bacillota bacterium]HPO97739.1 hypothetical protein [Bacillota bacterium]